MSAVMIRCPVTGQAVSTQIETEPSIFETLPQVEAHTLCPVCGQEHIWTLRDAWLQESKGPGRVERLPPTLLP